MALAEVFSRKEVSSVVAPDADACLISIWSTIALATEWYAELPIGFDGWKDSIKLEFDDVVNLSDRRYGFDSLRFSGEMAESLLDFIEKHKGSNFVIHCDAGISRSVAVGAFLRDFYDYEARFYVTKHDEHRNMWVYNLLRRTWMKKNGSEIEG